MGKGTVYGPQENRFYTNRSCLYPWPDSDPYRLITIVRILCTPFFYFQSMDSFGQPPSQKGFLETIWTSVQLVQAQKGENNGGILVFPPP